MVEAAGIAVARPRRGSGAAAFSNRRAKRAQPTSMTAACHEEGDTPLFRSEAVSGEPSQKKMPGIASGDPRHRARVVGPGLRSRVHHGELGGGVEREP
jgi:hypothetical protein